jgi:hypothetical protein
MGSGDDQFDFPNGIAVDANDYIYVTGGNKGVEKFTNNGDFVSSWGDFRANEIAFDPSGDIYISSNNTIQKFSYSFYIEAISSLSGTAGNTITITGAGFSTTPTENIVKINGVQASVISSTSTSITVVIPASATSGLITVEVQGNTAESPVDFSVITSVTSEVEKESQFGTVHPNPMDRSKDLLSIFIDLPNGRNEVSLNLNSIFGGGGKLSDERLYEGGNQLIQWKDNFSQLSSGIYLLQVKVKDAYGKISTNYQKVILQ